VPTTDAASAETGTGSTRRRLLGAGLAGSVLGVVGARQVGASGGSSTTTEPAAATSAPAATQAAATTTAPPRQPTPADVELLAFILTAEMAASDLYNDAAAVEGLDEQAASLYTVFAEHHRAYANTISAMLTKAADNVANAAVVAEFGSDMTGGQATRRARELEMALVATHLDALGKVEGVEAAERLAAIVVVEGQHIAALAALEGLDPDRDYDAFVTETADALTPDDYPASA
jgi:ferritin-like protein